MTRPLLTALVLAGLSAAPAAAGPRLAQGSPAPAPGGGAAAYPNNPAGTPAAEREARPVTAPCPPGSPCPGRPEPSGAADTSRTGTPSTSAGRTDRVPSTAYPDAPGGMPSSRPDGTAPR
ncbi:hypothetical protein [Methylobacterium oryzisoli]|uniref:hypothetical protein n=1 Tax=Methylobacterium oryzisoli TaxID=3385502 RepID=UPI0038913615